MTIDEKIKQLFELHDGFVTKTEFQESARKKANSGYSYMQQAIDLQEQKDKGC